MPVVIRIEIPDGYYTKEVQKLMDEWQSELGTWCSGSDEWSEMVV
jgi:hypothetical protein